MVFPPGSTITDELEERNIPEKDLAKALNFTPSELQSLTCRRNAR